MNLDDLLQSIREDEMLSPKDAAGHKNKISSEKFFNLTQELKAEGTIKGEKLTGAERKEGFKKSKDPVEFKKFVEKVLARKKDAGGGASIKSKGQKLLTGTTFKALPGVGDADINSPDGDKPKRKKSLLTFVKQINNRVGGILTILEKRADVEADTSQEKSQEKEKDTRAAKEKESEKKKKGLGIPGPIAKMAEPVTSLWDNIIKTIGRLLIGWGLIKFLKWLQDPKNKKAVEDFKEFITVAVPAILKGVLAIVGYNIAKTLVKFTAGLVVGAGKMLLFLGKMAMNLIKWAGKNRRLALGLGLAAMAGLAIQKMSQKKEKKNQEEGTEISTAEQGAIDVEDDVNSGAIPDKSLKFNKGGQVPMLGNLIGGVQNMAQAGTEKAQAAGNAVMGMGSNMIGGVGGMIQDSPIGNMFGMKPKGTDTVPAMLTPGESVLQVGARERMMQDTGVDPLDYNIGVGANKPQVEEGTTYASTGGQVGDMATGDDLAAVNQERAMFGQSPLMPRVSSKNIFNMIGNKKSSTSSGWSTSKTVKKPSIWKSIKGTVSGAAGSVKNFFTGGGKKKDAEQLLSSPPGKGGKGGIVALPIPKSESGSSNGGQENQTASERLFSPIDTNNLSTLVTKSMYSILD